MTLQKLACFVQLAECLNFSEAAQRLHITQPSLSRQIVSLERELGVQLFERNTRKVTLTQAGREMANEARDVIRRSNNLQILAQQLSQGCIGKLAVGYSSAMDACILARFLAESRNYRPRLEFTLHRQNQGRLLASLRSGEVDVAFLFKNGFVETSGLRTIAVAESRLCLLLPKDHRLAERESLPITELEGLPLSIMDRSESAASYDNFLALCQRNHVIPDIAQLCEEPQVLMLNVVAGKGGAILPMGEGELPSFGNVAIPLLNGDEVVKESIVVAYNGDFRNEAVSTFLSWIRRYVGQY